MPHKFTIIDIPAEDGGIEKLIDHVLANQEVFGKAACFLCGRHADGTGLFVPDSGSHQVYGGRSGYSRLIVYGQCSRCAGIELDILEAKIQVDMLGDDAWIGQIRSATVN